VYNQPVEVTLYLTLLMSLHKENLDDTIPKFVVVPYFVSEIVSVIDSIHEVSGIVNGIDFIDEVKLSFLLILLMKKLVLILLPLLLISWKMLPLIQL
jgi:hypothetical protein